MEKKVRVRFAPSPTGGLHLGGVRTALFNYLFAKQHGGSFILRIEDTDQNRYVEGAEKYITECLAWCGLQPDESPNEGGKFGPYRQSERKSSYRQYAEQLVKAGNAYYAFDTAEELDEQRRLMPNFRYGIDNRNTLNNSLSRSDDEVNSMLLQGVPHVIRIKMPADETISFTDMIRGEVSFDTNLVDDKVLLKADGMPTYHLAVVVDDHLMEISHVFRGEEWLPSAPVHILLWDYLVWENSMPQWAHLPLILKPDGNGKLSKRDGDRLGFPVYAMNWTDPKTGILTSGFREMGFLPQAFINLLALLGWNDGTEQELFSIQDLVDKFSIERISKAGAKFDFEKAKWFNHEWIKLMSTDLLISPVKDFLREKNISSFDEIQLAKIIDLVKDRLNLVNDFWDQSFFFFEQPEEYDLDSVKPKWNTEKSGFFNSFIDQLNNSGAADAASIEQLFKTLAAEHNLKIGELMLPFRIMLVGGKFGPQVFDIAALLGKEETVSRIKKALITFN